MFEKPASVVALNDFKIPLVVDQMFWPGAGVTFDYEGKRMLNSYHCSGVEPCSAIDADGQRVIDMFMDHLRFTLSDEREQRILLDWMAYVIQNPGKREEELDWFGNLIRMMNEEGKREGGHLNINKVILKDVIDLHGMLLQSTKFPIYNAEYYKVLPFIVELRQRGDKDLNEIETCLDALYGVMMLRLQKKEITPETERAIKEITVFIGLLSDYYIKDRTEGLKFDDDDM
jgi:flagellin-specific chaperone FliS